MSVWVTSIRFKFLWLSRTMTVRTPATRTLKHVDCNIIMLLIWQRWFWWVFSPRPTGRIRQNWWQWLWAPICSHHDPLVGVELGSHLPPVCTQVGRQVRCQGHLKYKNLSKILTQWFENFTFYITRFSLPASTVDFTAKLAALKYKNFTCGWFETNSHYGGSGGTT